MERCQHPVGLIQFECEANDCCALVWECVFVCKLTLRRILNGKYTFFWYESVCSDS